MAASGPHVGGAGGRRSAAAGGAPATAPGTWPRRPGVHLPPPCQGGPDGVRAAEKVVWYQSWGEVLAASSPGMARAPGGRLPYAPLQLPRRQGRPDLPAVATTLPLDNFWGAGQHPRGTPLREVPQSRSGRDPAASSGLRGFRSLSAFRCWQVRSRYEITCPFIGISLRLLMPFPEFLRSSYSLTTLTAHWGIRKGLRSPRRYSSSRVPASSIAWRSVSGACALTPRCGD